MTSHAPRRLRHVRAFALAALWLPFAAWMSVNALQDPYDPLLEGTRRYGHNHQGALRDGIVTSLVELAVVYLVLQPWKTSGRAWLRGVVALMAFIPWTLLSAVLTMHAGGVVTIHLLWLLAVDVVVVAIVVVSLVAPARWAARRGDPRAPNSLNPE